MVEMKAKAFPWVYGIQCGDFIKVGVAGNIKFRLTTLQLYNPYPCKVVMRRQHRFAYRIEKRIHELLADVSIGREWFNACPKAVQLAADIAMEDVRSWEFAQEWEVLESVQKP
jgi:hypothetical protein